MDISVIICSYNRCESLRRTLATCCELVIPAGVKWELVVVDNNSTDNTKTVCSTFEKVLPLRYVKEEQLGLARARNRSVREAAGDLLLFTDDDVVFESNWLMSYWDAAHRHPEIDFFGGNIVPHWEATPPAWLLENLDWLWHITHVDKGPSELELPIAGPYFCGANMAYRRRAFGTGIAFNEEYGVRGTERRAGDEGELQRRLLQAGFRGLYVPNAVVRHREPANRLTERYLRHFHKGYGVSSVRFGDKSLVENTVGATWFDIPRWYWRKFLGICLRYATKRLSRPSREWLEAEIAMAHMWGIICETRKQRSSRNRPNTAPTS